MILCLNCQTENREPSKFCSHCGAKLLDPSDTDYRAEMLKAESRRMAQQSVVPQDKLSQSVRSIELEYHSFTALSVLSICLLIIGLALLLIGGASFANSFNPPIATTTYPPTQFNAPSLSGGQAQPSKLDLLLSSLGNIFNPIVSMLAGFVSIVASEFVKVQIALVENTDKQAMLTRAIYQAMMLNNNRKE